MLGAVEASCCIDLENVSDTAVPMVDVVEANCNAVVLALLALLLSIRWTEQGARTCLLSAKVGSHLPRESKIMHSVLLV